MMPNRLISLSKCLRDEKTATHSENAPAHYSALIVDGKGEAVTEGDYNWTELLILEVLDDHWIGFEFFTIHHLFRVVFLGNLVDLAAESAFVIDAPGPELWK